MSALRLSWTVAGTSAMGAGAFQSAGDVSPSATSDLIGLVPLNPATLTPPGYVDTVAQYGADQLTFAFSQGEYTAFGATPQTFVQNLLGSASPLLQFSAASQAMYNTVNIQNDLFATNAQMFAISSYMSPFAAPAAVTGFSAGNTAFGPAFSLPALTAYNNTTLVTSITQGIDATPATALTPTTNGLGLPGIDQNAMSNNISNVTDGAPSLFGQASNNATQTLGEHGIGVTDTLSSVVAAPTTNPAAVASNAGSSVAHDQVNPVQGALPTGGITQATFSAESLNVKPLSADPFAHYSHLTQNDHSVQGMMAGDHGGSLAQEMVTAATAIAGSNSISAFHFAYAVDSHEIQASDAHGDPFSHALQHTATAGGHLV